MVPSLADGSEFYLILGSLGTAALGGWHCAGMCGPIAALARSRSAVVAHQLGRLTSYLALGALAGMLGEHVLHLLPTEHLWLAGVALGMLAFWMMLSAWNLELLRDLQKFLWRKRPRGSVFVEYFALGALNGMLPCHWLYGFVVLGAGLGSPARSMILLAALWAGSLPWLIATALLGRQLRRNPRVAAWAPPVLMLAVVASLFLHQLHQLHQHHH